MRKNRILREENGSALPLITLLMVIILLGVMALVVDAGIAYNKRRELVTAADAAAIGGAKIMEKAMKEQTNETQAQLHAEDIAQGLAEENDVDLANIQITWNNSDYERDTITVVVTAQQNLFFARFFGFESINVAAKAVATWGYATDIESGPILPLFMKDEDYQIDDITYLHFDKFVLSTSDLGVGNWGLLDLFGATSKLIDAFEGKKMDADISIDETINNQTGNHGNDMINGIETRMQIAATLETPEDRQEYMCGLVPIITWSEVTNQGSSLILPIDAFAVFEIRDVIVSEGNNKTKRSEGSPYALDTTNYVSDGIAEEYDQVERTIYDSHGELITETTDLTKTTIIGQFTGQEISVRAVMHEGDQENPDDSVASVTYARLME